ncbi:hypothetical protein BHE74_00011309 [Ensete ventricosum]|nr:hypothetical protein BHE74_00011309 [Ensete ventricosum]
MGKGSDGQSREINGDEEEWQAATSDDRWRDAGDKSNADGVGGCGRRQEGVVVVEGEGRGGSDIGMRSYQRWLPLRRAQLCGLQVEDEGGDSRGKKRKKMRATVGVWGVATVGGSGDWRQATRDEKERRNNYGKW